MDAKNALESLLYVYKAQNPPQPVLDQLQEELDWLESHQEEEAFVYLEKQQKVQELMKAHDTSASVPPSTSPTTPENTTSGPTIEEVD